MTPGLFNAHINLSFPLTAIAPDTGGYDAGGQSVLAALADGANTAGSKEYTGDANIDFSNWAAASGTVAMDKLKVVMIEVIRTAATATGSVTLSSTPLGLASRVITVTGNYAAGGIGQVLETIVIASGQQVGSDLTSATHLALDFTLPVGFKVRVRAAGRGAGG